jgi:hypothetical protein
MSLGLSTYGAVLIPADEEPEGGLGFVDDESEGSDGDNFSEIK